MGGELKVRSTVGQGSEFWFDLTLPVAQAPELDESSLGQDLPTGKALAACGANVVVSIHIRHCWRMNLGMMICHCLASAGSMTNRVELDIKRTARSAPWSWVWQLQTDSWASGPTWTCAGKQWQ